MCMWGDRKRFSHLSCISNSQSYITFEPRWTVMFFIWLVYRVFRLQERDIDTFAFLPSVLNVSLFRVITVDSCDSCLEFKDWVFMLNCCIKVVHRQLSSDSSAFYKSVNNKHRWPWLSEWFWNVSLYYLSEFNRSIQIQHKRRNSNDS